MSFSKKSGSKRRNSLTPEQRRIYAAEKLDNFRWISKLVATYSSYTLSSADLAEDEVYREVADLGQFAEITYSSISSIDIAFLLDNYPTLTEPTFPLENYDGLQGASLVLAFRGSFADLPGYVAFRPNKGQLIVAISGTSTVQLALQDLRVVKSPHPSGHGTVHTGFWLLYQGVKGRILEGIQSGLAKHEVRELVITGHSMGGSIGYLLCLDLLTQQLPPDGHKPKLKLAVFGVPRTGDAKLVEYFRQSVASHLASQGQDSFVEISVKGYNDGVPALPPVRLGYRHFAKEPFYTQDGKLYRTPASESEHALFHLQPSDEDDTESGAFLFPRGGHNYYNGRDLERFIRRIAWLDRSNPQEEGWEVRYASLVKENQ